jgi:hypothetical protein
MILIPIKGYIHKDLVFAGYVDGIVGTNSADNRVYYLDGRSISYTLKVDDITHTLMLINTSNKPRIDLMTWFQDLTGSDKLHVLSLLKNGDLIEIDELGMYRVVPAKQVTLTTSEVSEDDYAYQVIRKVLRIVSAVELTSFTVWFIVKTIR